MARIEIEVHVKVKISVPDTAAWAVDYGLADDSPEAVEADVRDYFGHGGIADELRNRPGQASLTWRVAEASDELIDVRVFQPPQPAAT